MLSSTQNFNQSDLRQLIETALETEEFMPLEAYLLERGVLPDAHFNTALIEAFASLAGQIVAQPEALVARLEAMLDKWAAVPIETQPVESAAQLLPAIAAMSYGQVAVSRPDWWDDEVGKLHTLAANSYFQLRLAVVAALRLMLAADSAKTTSVLTAWLHQTDKVVVEIANTVLNSDGNE